MTTTQQTPATGEAFRLPDEYQDLRASVRAFAQQRLGPIAAEVDAADAFSPAAYRELTAAGFHALGVPERYSGAGADALAQAVAVEEIARVSAGISTVLTSNKLGVTPLLLGGTEEQRARYLPSVATGDVLCAYAISEREAGSDVAAMRCRAVRDGDGWRLDGTKSWITSAGEAGLLVVFAVTDPGAGSRSASAFLVEAADAGIAYGAPERKMGLHGSVTREVHLDGVRIPADRLLGERGRGVHLALATLDHTRVSIAAQAVGIAQGALDYAVGYVRERRQFGQAIAEFQGVQFMIADMAMAIEAARALAYRAAAAAQSGAPDLAFLGAAAKCLASDTAMSVTTDAVQLLGGAGYVRDHPVERMMRDAKITQIYEGTNQIQRVVMARALLKG
ncbi:acyl-CoA dehydrogenase family protein [Amycolatopsis benzoatilytica]|uniref:acyl-CoA dehydrogenase family protein n=1 Tax=Amycolatopsis benzoatilytica TaxID=346045 RepID=UPI0003651359|nr:acyl-CoA dehydrogenase family protein [Amycolatopsis benzoatilytica]